MIINILTKGLPLRCFVVFIWLIALISRCFDSGEETKIAAIFLGGANGFLYLSVALRLVTLTNHSVAKLLPDYFSQLKRSLLLILGVSLIPTLMILPNIVMWLSLLSILLLMALSFVAITYQPRIYFAALPLLFSGYLIKGSDFLDALVLPMNISMMLALALPIIAGLTYWLLARLEAYKGDPKQIERIITLTGLNMNGSVTELEKVPLKLQNRLVQWIANSNFEYYRQLIRSKITMTNTQRIAIVCQGNSTIGRTSYCILGALIIVFSWGGSYFEGEYQDILIMVIKMLPMLIFMLGTIGFYQVINSKRGLLKRLSIMPCFSNNQSFSLAFITYVLSEQLKLFVFVTLILAIFTYSFESLILFTYLNSLVVLLTVWLFQLTLMFLAWSSKFPNNTTVIWLMIFAIYGGYFVLAINFDGELLLWINKAALIWLAIAFGLSSMSLYRGYRKIPQSV